MRTILLAGAAALLPMLAQAAPIAAGSELSLDGTDTFTATSVTFVGDGNIGFGTGSFAGLSCDNCMAMTSFTSSTATPFDLYSGDGTSLSVSSDTFDFTPGRLQNLTVNGTGVLSLTGFTPTAGSFILTTQGPRGSEVTFSVTSVASAPEPASLAILGTGLLGLGFIVRRKQQH